MHEKSLSYRPDIDGLRAIAVLLVVFFHINLNLVPGGYIGVDIFFVISGFLITKIIHKEITTGSFSIAGFYARRARRIIPAFASVIIVTSIFASLLLYPSELVNYAKSAIASSLFSANIYFYSSLDYFSPSADEIPLLHIWSLGVEEQFYIIFPLILICAAKIRLPASIATCALFLASVAASVYMLEKSQPAAFYLLPFRAFEILIGSAVALSFSKHTPNKNSSTLLFIAGILCIAIANIFYTHNTKFPGLAALLPCAGAALIIIAGQANSAPLSKMLGGKTLVFIGKISFSLYLVHWPVIVFLKRFNLDINEYQFAVIAFSLSMILAVANYQFIEKKFRHVKENGTTAKTLTTALAVLVSMIAVSIATISNNGFEDDSNARLNKVLSYLKYDATADYRSGTCFLNPDQIPSSVDISSCLPDAHGEKAMLWGDSHAIQFYPGMKNMMQIRGYSLGALTASACPPILGQAIADRPNCVAFNDMAYLEILKVHPDVLILSANWNAAVDQSMNKLDETVKRFAGTGIKVYILGISPTYKRAVPIIIADQMKSGQVDFSAPKDIEQDWITYNETAMADKFSNRSDVKYISVIEAVCPAGKCPLVDAGGIPVHFDVSHLTPEGSRLMSKNIISEMFN